MTIIALKLALTALLIGIASLGARRWGPIAGGWIAALPLTSGPVALFLALDRGPTFAAAAAHSALAGCLAIAAYGLTYARLADRGWQAALTVATGAWLAGALVAVATAAWVVPANLAVAIAAMAAALILLPARAAGRPVAPSRRQDIVIRMVVGALAVVAVTELAPFVGSAVAGLLAMLPIIGTIMAVFAQRSGGPSDGVGVQRGILSGQFGSAAFLAIIAWTIAPWGIGPAFIGAIAVAVVAQVIVVRLFARTGEASPESPDAASEPA